MAIRSFLRAWFLGAIVAGGCLVQARAVAAPGQDMVGSRDHPLVKRYQDSFIFQYSTQEYGEYGLALGKALNPSVPASGGRSMESEQMIEGKITRISYLAPAGRTTLEVFRNYQQDLADKGFNPLFSGTKEELGYMFCKRYQGIFSQIFDYNNEGSRYVAARLDRPEGRVTVAVFVTEFQMGLSGGLVPAKGQPLVQVDIVEEKPMEQRMVVVSAEKMAGGIEAEGHIALYGIYFDFNEATLKPESSPTIEQMAKFLLGAPGIKVMVVGHTDNAGGFDYNLRLSRRRAEAVVNELVARHGIEASRLTPMGASYLAPVGSNRSEEGRAKNRRVELVEM
ncbi:MAG: DUF4892 domain-containing protein [Verrucomicrobiae bacterium]|nr:DUF4892 domain-containing protein [Verrucomicrobiae bacterium]